MKHTLITLPTQELAEAVDTDLTKNTGAKTETIATIPGWKVIYDDLNHSNPALDGKQKFAQGWLLAASRFAGESANQQAKN